MNSGVIPSVAYQLGKSGYEWLFGRLQRGQYYANSAFLRSDSHEWFRKPLDQNQPPLELWFYAVRNCCRYVLFNIWLF